MTDYREKAREIMIHGLKHPADNPCEKCSAIAAALKEIAEEAVRSLGECDECGSPYSFDPTDGGSICVPCYRAKFRAAELKLAAVESATPESPEVKEAVEYFVSREGGHSYLAASVHGLKLVDAYRSALVRIKELEDDVAANAYTQGMVESSLAKLAKAKEIEETAIKVGIFDYARAEAALAKLAKAKERIKGLEQDCDKHHDLTIMCLEKDLRAAEAKLAALSASVGDEEEREALESWAHDWRQNADPMGHKWFCRFCQIGTDTELSDICPGKYQVVRRSLRAKTAALREAEARIKTLETIQASCGQWDETKKCHEAERAEVKLAALEKNKRSHSQFLLSDA